MHDMDINEVGVLFRGQAVYGLCTVVKRISCSFLFFKKIGFGHPQVENLSSFLSNPVPLMLFTSLFEFFFAGSTKNFWKFSTESDGILSFF